MLVETSPNNILFVDFDECLFHAFFAYSEKQCAADAAMTPELDSFGFSLVNNYRKGALDWYLAVLRPTTHEFLEWARTEFGHENVLVLTTATRDYAEAINAGLKLGFENSQIFSRENIKDYNHPKYPHTGNFVLVDNMPYIEHCDGRYNKVRFLHSLPRTKYVKVPDYWGDSDEGFNFKDIYENIKEAFKYEIQTNQKLFHLSKCSKTNMRARESLS